MTRLEIGSEFSLDATSLQVQSDHIIRRLQGYRTVFFGNGRSAIRSILRQIKGKRALLPSYICQSVVQAFEKENYAVDFYKININLSLELDDIIKKVNPDTDVLFVMHYYGALQNQTDLDRLKALCTKISVTVIEDTTHSFLTKLQTIGDYCVASLRKWFALPDGGVTYSKSHDIVSNADADGTLFSNARAAGMFLKGLYLNQASNDNASYRKLFAEAESHMDEENGIVAQTELSSHLLRTFDVGNAQRARKNNASYLTRNLRNPKVKFVFSEKGDEYCSFFYPLWVSDRDEFRDYLNRNAIYCPVHWPIEDKRLLEYEETRYIYKHILSLPIDQRYGLTEMKYLCDVVNQYELISGG